ncbi:MAG TPA: hypothetical protein VMO52_01660 [Acidimicrobiia bacterium]|nr:hypothetical protein [Acidimicrobiia bacterium]
MAYVTERENRELKRTAAIDRRIFVAPSLLETDELIGLGGFLEPSPEHEIPMMGLSSWSSAAGDAAGREPRRWRESWSTWVMATGTGWR